ncbi:MAG: prolipoprotein diacylglyceryl transferase [candidate division WOR-3 bacterium]|nr:prolipoprotein diacylglyceryl transferase [candidate division WOR-3 bacterium]
MDNTFVINPEKYIHIYPTFYLLAVYIGFIIVLYEIYRRRLPLMPLLVTMVWGLICAIIGSKLFTIAPAEFFQKIKSGSILSVHEKVYIGWLLGGMLGIKIFRKILGFRFDLFDLFAFALPVGFAFMRIGCLFGGCCFGKPADLIWSICYTHNSPCYDYQLHHGLIEPFAKSSLPVQPAQVYEIVAMILIVFLLFNLRGHLKKPGSLGYTYLILHSMFRFFIDFTKEGGTYIYGLKLIQWFLLFLIPIGTFFIIWREKRFGSNGAYKFVERPILLNFLIYLPALSFLIFLPEWLTPAEFRVMLIINLVACGFFVYRFIKYLNRYSRLFIRIPATIASITILETSNDTTITRDTLRNAFFIEVDGGYMKGAYQEICGGLVQYSGGGMGVGGYFRDAEHTIIGVNVKSYFFDFDGERFNPYLAGSGSFVFNHRYVGFVLGGGMVFDYNGDDAYDRVYPSVGARLGLRDKAFIEGEFLKHSPADLPTPVMKVGIGFGSGNLNNETHFRFGISFLDGFYIHPVIYFFNNRLRISPYLSGGAEPDVYQINLTIGYRHYFR